MRVENGEVTLKTRKGLDWTAKFGAIAKATSELPDCMIDGGSSLSTTAALLISQVFRPRCLKGRPMT